MHRLIVLLLVILPVVAAAQRAEYRIDEDLLNPYDHEMTVALRMHINGFSGGIENNWIRGPKRTVVLQTDFFYHRDFRQKRIDGIGSNTFLGSRYFYGMQNRFFSLNVGAGVRRVIAEKEDHKGVRLSMTYSGGLSLGFLKPYALDLYPALADDPTTPDYFREPQPETYSESNADRFLDQRFIAGSSGIGSGWSGLAVVPGAHGRFAFNFDWSGNEEMIIMLETGVQVQAYYRKLDVMLNETNRPLVFSLYLAVIMGKRW